MPSRDASESLHPQAVGGIVFSPSLIRDEVAVKGAGHFPIAGAVQQCVGGLQFKGPARRARFARLQ